MSETELNYLRDIAEKSDCIIKGQNALRAGQADLRKELDEIKEDVHLIREVATGADKKSDKALTLLDVAKERIEEHRIKSERDKDILYVNYRKEIAEAESRMTNKMKTASAEGKFWTVFHFLMVVGYVVTTAIAIYAVAK